MSYEVDIIGVDKEAKDADAICFRYDNGSGDYIVGVYDGGTKDYGEALKNHMLQYYFDGADTGTIDFVVCSHSDGDHASGLSVILESFQVKKLYMNRPWLYVDELFPKVSDGRITKNSLYEHLRKSYKYISELEDIANEKNIPIYETFTGTKIGDRLYVLSPNKSFFLDLIVESEKTPLDEASLAEAIKSLLIRAANWVKEAWEDEHLTEDVSTTAENETCIILYGDMEDEKFLLTGDAGIRALRNAEDYASSRYVLLKNCTFQQMPHHGSRHNVSPAILNDLLGYKLNDNSDVATKIVFVSVSKGSDHPRRVVINAYKRRGAKVFEARTGTLNHSRGSMPKRNWTTAQELPFYDEVEE